MTKSIMIVGVGGQGTLLTSRILGGTVIGEGYDVKVSEVHGMSQRGGSVTTYVRYGDAVASPIIGEGEADIILAFEELEAYRALPYLRAGGKMIVNTQKIDPMPVITGAAEYPAGIIGKLSKQVDITTADALALAKQAGSPKAANVVMIGLLARSTDIVYEKWVACVKATVPPRFLEANLRAFDLGWGK